MNHECGLDITYCDECNTELEEGQVGTCEDCKICNFEELSDKAKQKARDDFTARDYPYHDWWDSVFEDANEIATRLGLAIRTSRQAKNGKQITDLNISFSGFWSQGDGACFRGQYKYNPAAVADIQHYAPNDKELLRIATELTVMQITQRLQGLEYFSAGITTSSNYSHSNTMSFDIYEYGIDEIGQPDEKQFAQLMRDFADWIYGQLEHERDYLYSDEVVDNYLQEEKFDRFGAIV